MKVIKKPLIVDAWQLDSDEYMDIPDWVFDAMMRRNLSCVKQVNNVARWTVHTLEGDAISHDGDYLIKGAYGELYPCKREIFEDTYEVLKE